MKRKIEDMVFKILGETEEPTAGLIKVKLEQMGYKLSYDTVSKHLQMITDRGIIGRKTKRDFIGAVDGKKHWGWHYYTFKNHYKK